MQAAYFDEPGPVDHIIVGNLPVPSVHANEVLLEVHAVSVNNVDLFVRSGQYVTPLVPHQLIGRDAVGVVVGVGAGVTTFKAGDWVWTNSMGYDGRNGVTAEYAAVPAERLTRVPLGVDPVQLVAAVHASATAALLLRLAHLVPGQSLLITGAHGHVGQKLVTLGKAQGLNVTVTASQRDLAELGALGADAAYEYGVGFAARLPRHYDTVIDTSGRVPLQTQLDLLANYGTVLLITAPADGQATINQRAFYMADKSIRGFVISKAPLADIQAAAAQLNQAFAQGQLLADTVTQMPFSAARAAHTLLATHGTRDKVVLVPDRLYK